MHSPRICNASNEARSVAQQASDGVEDGLQPDESNRGGNRYRRFHPPQRLESFTMQKGPQSSNQAEPADAVGQLPQPAGPDWL